MQYDFGIIDPDDVSGTDLAEILGNFRTALNTNHAGVTPPAYLEENMIWIDTSGSNAILRFYDGVESVEIGTINPTTHTFFPDGVDPPLAVQTTAINITLNEASNKRVIRATAGVTLAIADVATLSDGWSVFIDARGGAVVVDPNDSQQVNGALTDTVASGSFGMLYKDGAGFYLSKPPIVGSRGAFTNLASAATTDLGSQISTALNITGAVNITSFGTSAAEGTEYLLRFNGTLTIAAGANIVTPSGGNITTYSGMYMLLKMDASNVWRILWFTSRLQETGGGANKLTFDLSAYSANRKTTWPDGDVTIPAGTLLSAASVPLTKGFESAAQTITTGGQLTIAHGLGAVPKTYVIWLVCVTAENGYTAGQRVGFDTAAIPTNRGLSVIVDATNVVLRFGSAAFAITNASTGASGSLTPANWNLVVGVYA